MKRKVILQANQAYTITLPIDWVRKYKISKNSELNVETLGRSLSLTTEKPAAGKSIKLDLSGADRINIYMHIISAYAQGVDEIIIGSDKDISTKITKALNNTMGYALIEQKKNTFKIKDINPGSFPNLDEIFKRVFQMILLFYEAAMKDIFGKEKETRQGLIARDAEINKFCLYLQRAINKMSYQDQTKGRIIFTYSYALEKLSDEIQRMWRTNISYNVKKSDEIKNILEDIKCGLESAFDLYYQFNKSKIEVIRSTRDKVRQKIQKLKKLDADTNRFIRHAVKIIEEATDMNHLALMKQY